MRVMSTLSDAPISTLHHWHKEQQPLVRALSGPMVETMSAAFEMMQGVIDGQGTQMTALGATNAEQQRLLTVLASLVERQGDSLKAAESSLTDALTSVSAACARYHLRARYTLSLGDSRASDTEAEALARLLLWHLGRWLPKKTDC